MSSDAGCADLIPASGASLARATSYTAWMKEKRARQTITNPGHALGVLSFSTRRRVLRQQPHHTFLTVCHPQASRNLLLLQRSRLLW